MEDRIILAVLAITLGVVVGVLVFVPFVALSFRRRGGFGVGRFLLWGAALVAVMAIWTYTLLPLPDPDAIRCAGVNVDVTALAADVRGALARRGGEAATDPAVAQLLLNVLLFVPLGFFIRVLGDRGVITALVVGFALSAFVEVTQLTGVWGLYPCAYRVFDVDDLLTNTLGAVLGSLLALAVPRRLRGSPRLPDADEPQPVTRGRRLLGMVCDGLAAWLLSLSVVVVVQLTLYLLGAEAAVQDGSAASLVGSAAPIAVWLVVTLATGATVGDHAVQLRFAGGPLPVGLARVLRFLGGIGGWLLLTALPGAWTFVAAVFAGVSVVLVVTTGGRGLPGLVSGQRVIDAREPEEPDAAPPGAASAPGV
ncbi:VanZ family protein [Microbacterium sp. QXD-8]|uniref:VanZ family protein n=1 Tax=Microbacterium psychrotolerans TaxID=3068321 RepID=A0ABU0YWV2_9MICO|nr:VanZ family protein [Microbacterium sp. QXD-8]MDQ7876797.1 VanZ family protein [Microbacterium sp. QXD-8]